LPIPLPLLDITDPLGSVIEAAAKRYADPHKKFRSLTQLRRWKTPNGQERKRGS
jgi:hypothetical protein